MRVMFLILLVLLPALVRAAPCDPAVVLEGPAELQRAVEAQLLRQGVPPPAPGCPGLRVRLGANGAHLQVAPADDPSWPRSARLVADVPAAATLIESWLRSDISAPLLGARPLIITTPPPPPPAPPLPSAPLPPPPPRAALALRQETTVASDGTPWLGFSALACARIGRLCVGLLGRFAEDLRPPALTLPGATLRRWDGELLLTANLPIAYRRVTFGPSAGFGGGLMIDSARNTYTTADALSGGVRIELGFSASVRVVAALSLEAGLALGVALPSTTGGALLRSGRIDDSQFLSTVVPLPAPPWGALRLQLGLRWGIL